MTYPYPTPVHKERPSTVPAFRKAVEDALQRRHPDTGIRIRWTRRPQAVTFPTGKDGFIGEVTVSGPGYRTRVFTVSLCGNQLAAH